jgi:erythromycin esterase-like protein
MGTTSSADSNVSPLKKARLSESQDRPPKKSNNNNVDRVATNLASQVQPFQLAQVLNSGSDLQKSFFDKNIPYENEILLLGESTHGTQEFYEVRQQLTKYLIQTRDYRLILIEAEWPDVYIVNQYITTPQSQSNTARDALGNITGSGKHMWQNEVIIGLVEWIKEHNKNLNYNPSKITYLFGIDCQQIYRSLNNIYESLQEIDLQYCSDIKTTLAFFNGFNGSEWEYAAKTVGQIGSELIPEILQKVLSEFQWQKFEEYKNKLPKEKLIDLINIEQNLEVLLSAEEYFRKRQLEPRGSQVSWNTRDQHMTLVVNRIRDRIKLITDSHENESSGLGMI